MSSYKTKPTTLQEIDLQQKRNTLQRRIVAWQRVQAIYMPYTRTSPENDTDMGDSMTDTTCVPEKIPLQLPSGVPRSQWLNNSLPDKERRLRLAQAKDALEELKRLLRVTMGLWNYKFTQLGPSQRAGTRARSMITRFRNKVNHCADRYRAARGALRVLDPNGGRTACLRELVAKELRQPCIVEEDVSKGRRDLSWLWLQNSGTSATEDEIGDSELASLGKYCGFNCSL